MAPHWYELVRQLQTLPDNDSGQPRKRLDQTNVNSLLTEAVRVASQDSDWNSSGLPESLQRALDLCNKQGPAAASAAALRLLDFQHIVEAKSSNSPKGSPKQGPSLAATTEVHVSTVEPQRKDSQSRASVPVITIKGSSEFRSTPATTTIVLQPSSVNSSAAQHSRSGSVSPVADPTFSLQSIPHRNGACESTKLHVLKIKNGRSNGSQQTALSKSSPHTDAAANQPSHTVREVSNGQRPEPSVDNTSGGSILSGEPMRAGSPPAHNAASSTGSLGTTRTGASVQAQSQAKPQAQASPFEAAEAQSHSRESLESRQSNSDSDKSCESAGTAKRSRPQNSGVDSPAVAKTSKRQRGACGLERVVSLSTVLRCVDTRADKEGSFDAAVGQRPATVHEVTEGFHALGVNHTAKTPDLSVGPPGASGGSPAWLTPGTWDPLADNTVTMLRINSINHKQ